MEVYDFFDSEIRDWLGTPDFTDDVDALHEAASVEYESCVGSTQHATHTDFVRGPPTTSSHAHVPSCSHPRFYEPLPPTQDTNAPSSSHSRYAPPKTDAEIASAREKGVPQKTKQDTKYCTKLWDEWRQHRMQTTGVIIAELHLLPLNELAY